MSRETTNPGWLDSATYKADPDNNPTPDTDHHEYTRGLNSNVLASQSDIQLLTPLIPTQNQKDALDANATLNAGNGVASIADVAASAATAFGLYNFRTDLTAPANGEIKLDNATPASAVEVKVANLNINGSNIGNLLMNLGANDAVLLQGQAGDLYNYDIIGAPTQTGGSGSGGYVTLPVASFDITGVLSDLEVTTALFLYDGNNTRFLQKVNDLSDLNNLATARTNLDVYSKAEALSVANNLGDVGNAITARTNLGVYSTAQSDANFLAKAANLSDVANAATARGNLSAQLTSSILDDIAGLTLAEGDIIYANGGPNFVVLNAGSEADVLTLATGIPSWAPPASATAIVKGHIFGLEFSQGAVPADDLSLAVGEATSDDGTALLVLPSTLEKGIDGAFVKGNLAGGLFSGIVAANTTYHLHLIREISTGDIDWGYDTSVTAANIPAGWEKARRIGSRKTDGLANLLPSRQNGDTVLVDTPPLDVNASLGTAAVLYTLSIPADIRVKVMMNIRSFKTANQPCIYISSPDSADLAPSTTGAPLCTIRSGINDEQDAHQAEVWSNTSSQIRARGDQAAIDFRVAMLGYVDTRNRF